MTSPISSTLTNSASEAIARASMSLKCFANFFATVSPTYRIPKANKTLSKTIFLMLLPQQLN